VKRGGRSFTVDVVPDGVGLVSHAGAALLAEVADRTGLTRELSRTLAGVRERRRRRVLQALSSPGALICLRMGGKERSVRRRRGLSALIEGSKRAWLIRRDHSLLREPSPRLSKALTDHPRPWNVAGAQNLTFIRPACEPLNRRDLGGIPTREGGLDVARASTCRERKWGAAMCER
jgi:hypothetical protein